MEAERLRVAKDLRARGAESAEVIRADADRRRTVILAEAYRESQTIRGEGDGAAAKIYADAYNQDKEFYGLYRSLDAYKKSFADKGDILILEPDTEFFKYFK
jgi:membrane protease subunit HflC